MEDNNNNFEELLNNSMKENDEKLGKIVTGKVIYISSKGEIYLDINYKSDGIIPKNEYSYDENCNPEDEVKIGDEITAIVLKTNDGEGNVLLSCKKIKRDQEKQAKIDNVNKFWETVKVGDKFEGTVASIMNYGAFIDLGSSVQGLLHISEITWEHNAKPEKYLKVGQKVNVFIKELDSENKKMSLGYEGKEKNPWETFEGNVGDVVNVTIKNMTTFGAFAEVTKGVEGLIHISQISTERIAKPEDKLTIGEKINAKIIGLDKENHKMELSIRELEGTSFETEKNEDDKNREE